MAEPIQTPARRPAWLRALILVLVSVVVLVVLEGVVRFFDPRLSFTLPDGLEWLAWSLLVAGGGLIVAAESVFLPIGRATGGPWDPTQHLVARGIYRWMRNPIYVGAGLLLFSVALFRASPTYLALAILFIPAIHLFVVYVEEPVTERRFGASYREYKARVPRWVPHLLLPT